VRASDKIDQWQDSNVDAAREPDNAGVEISGKRYRIELSLCGNEQFGRDQVSALKDAECRFNFSPI
jgi:hypothetical protein